MSLVARITALAQAVGADIKAISANVMDLAGTRRMTGALKEAPAVFIDSGTGSTLNLATANANTVYASGTGTVESLGSGVTGQTKRVYFQQSMTLRHGVSLIDLPGQSDIVTAVGDWAEFYCAGNDSWVCLQYQRRNGRALASTVDTSVLDLAGTRKMTGPVREAPFMEVHANGGTIDLATATGNSVRSNATNSNNTNGQVTSLGGLPIGEVRTIRFTSAGTLVHNIGVLRLPTEANIAVREGDTAQFISHGSGLWENRFYQRGDGSALAAIAAPVTSVAGKTGAVLLAKADVGLDQVDNTSDASKPISTAQAAAIATKTTPTEVLSQMQSFGFASSQMQTAGDADAVAETRFQRTTATTTLNRPFGVNGALLTMLYAANNSGQLYVTTTGRLGWRFNNGAAGTWNEGATLLSPGFSGIPTAPTPAVGTNTTQLQTTAGTIAQIQAYGLGAAAVTITDMNSVAGGFTQFFKAPVGGTNLPVASAVAGCYIGYAATSGVQLCGTLTTSATNTNKLFFRNYNASSWGAYKEIATIDAPSFTTSLQVAGPVKVGQYTMAALPSAAAFSGYEIDVTDASGGSKRCRSNGTVWQVLNTTTTVS